MTKFECEAYLLKNVFSALTAITNEATIHLNKSRIWCCVTDEPKVSMCYFELLPKFLQSYTPPEEEEERFTINIVDVSKYIKKLGKKEKVIVEFETDKLRIKSIEKELHERTFPTFQHIEEAKPISLNYHNRVKITTDAIDRVLSRAGTIAEAVVFELNPDDFIIHLQGNIPSIYYKTTFTKEHESLIKIECNGKAIAKYGLIYLSDIFGACKGITDVVTLEFDNDTPLHINFAVLFGRLEYWLAPRIEE